MRSFITGVTGFVGGHLAERLLNEGDQVFGLSHSGRWREETKFLSEQVHLFAADVADEQRVSQVLAEVRPERIYHLAAQANVPLSFDEPVATWTANQGGSEALFRAAASAVPESRLLHVSTGNVYGQLDALQMPITEETPPSPMSPYSKSKLAADEAALARANDGQHILVARPFNHAGPRQEPHYALSRFARQVALLERRDESRTMTVGNLDVYRDFSDVRDVVCAYCLLIENGRPGEIYNVASGTSFHLRRLLEALLSMSDAPITIEQDPKLLRKNDLERVEVSVSRLTGLGWQPRIPIEQTLRDTLEFWRSQSS